ncbi:histidine--tRNA ligase [Chloroflexus sp. Y-396-1]|uniref:histidine--tRNA ligase n=1 Tax=Chloroflexus sp. Y-396-1 TaxID=867845 RepID=UPI0004916D12|nr:histidine--tRNA ligase [Chloroflexus sp. Y-396-1]
MAPIQNVKGMRDHLPSDMMLRQYIVNTLTRISENHGFEPLQTPIIEYAETLEGKLGDDEKLIYRFEDHGGRRLALRYDQTVPLARVTAQYAGQLSFPWRRYAYGPSYRGERPARGRYREFYQFDLDIVGSSSPLADAEIIAILCEALAALGFPGFVTLLNHRQIIGGIARVSGLSEEAAGGVYRAIDKFDKIGPDGVRTELLKSGITPAAADHILELVQIDGTPDEVLHALSQQLADDERATAAIANLRAVLAGLTAMGVPPDQYRVAPRLARGLSYYTGVVFEAITPHWPEGSLLGGGRYDDLIGLFAGRQIPTVGLAFGIDRLHDVMLELNLGPRPRTTAFAFVTLFSVDQVADSLALAAELRAAGINTVIALEPGNIGKQFKEADRRGVRFALVLGPDELARGEVVVKDLQRGEQRSLPRAAAVSLLAEALNEGK